MRAGEPSLRETAFVQEFEFDADVVGQRPLAASHNDGDDEQMTLVDQPCLERVGGEGGTAHTEITSR
jgi:hypothetical protein